MIKTGQATNRESFLGVRLLTQKQVMEELQVSGVSLWQWRKQGMPYVPLGARCVRYSLPDVMEWLSERKAAPRGSEAQFERKEVAG